MTDRCFRFELWLATLDDLDLAAHTTDRAMDMLRGFLDTSVGLTKTITATYAILRACVVHSSWVFVFAALACGAPVKRPLHNHARARGISPEPRSILAHVREDDERMAWLLADNGANYSDCAEDVQQGFTVPAVVLRVLAQKHAAKRAANALYVALRRTSFGIIRQPRDVALIMAHMVYDTRRCQEWDQ